MSSHQHQTTPARLAPSRPGPGLLALLTLLDLVLLAAGVVTTSAGVFMLNKSALIFTNPTPPLAGAALLLVGLVPLIVVGVTARIAPIAPIIAGAVTLLIGLVAELLRFVVPPPPALWSAGDYHFWLVCGIASAAVGVAGFRTRFGGLGGIGALLAALVGAPVIVLGLVAVGFGSTQQSLVHNATLSQQVDPLAVMLLVIGAVLLFAGVAVLCLSEWVAAATTAIMGALQVFIIVAPMAYLGFWTSLGLGEIAMRSGVGNLPRTALLVVGVLAGTLLGRLLGRATASSSASTHPSLSSAPGYPT